MDVLFKILILAALAAFGALTLKKQAPEFAFLLTLGAGICILSMLASQLPSIQMVYTFAAHYIPDTDEIVGPMFKAAGICILTKITAETCRDCEQKALAAKVELAGTIACFAVAMPLFSQVFAQIESML